MPGGDRTGPMGMGPLTGRRMGFCASNAQPGFASWRGFGGGSGRGWRNRFYATGVPGWAAYAGYGVGAMPEYTRPDPEWGKQNLKDQAQALRSELDAIERRLSELEG